MALLFHELATNAAKYGALSRSVGKISVRWSYSDPWLNSNGVKARDRLSAFQIIAVSERGGRQQEAQAPSQQSL
jgi:two-component sensor histidine kinase